MSKNLNPTTIGLTIGLFIFICIFGVWLAHFINPNVSLERAITKVNFTIISILMIQFIYLSAEVVESFTEDERYTLVAYSAMIALGSMLLLFSVFNPAFRTLHTIIEGILYLGTGLTLLILKLRKQHENQHNLKHEE
jgi:hypothetical protein